MFSVSAEGSGTGNRDALGSSVCVLRCLRSPWQDGGRCQPRFDVTQFVGSLCETHHTLGLSIAFFAFVLCVTHVPKMLTARYVQSSAVATKCVDSRSLFFRTVCVLFFFTWFSIILSGQETETM